MKAPRRITRAELARLTSKPSASILAANGFTNEANPDATRVPHPKPKPVKRPALEPAIQGEAKSLQGTRVCFTGFRVRPLDPDNFAGSIKDLLDGLRHAHVIEGDEPWRITLETKQVRVRSFKEEKTVIEVEDFL